MLIFLLSLFVLSADSFAWFSTDTAMLFRCIDFLLDIDLIIIIHSFNAFFEGVPSLIFMYILNSSEQLTTEKFSDWYRITGIIYGLCSFLSGDFVGSNGYLGIQFNDYLEWQICGKRLFFQIFKVKLSNIIYFCIDILQCAHIIVFYS